MRKDWCLWGDECKELCNECDYYSPIDENTPREYEESLRERINEYEQMIEDYSDRSVFDEDIG